MEGDYTCDSCNRKIPLLNRTVHSLRCLRNQNDNRGKCKRDRYNDETKTNFQPNNEANVPPLHSQSNRGTEIPLVDLTTESPIQNSTSFWSCETCTYLNSISGNRCCEICGDFWNGSGHNDSFGVSEVPHVNRNNHHGQSSSSSSSYWSCDRCTFANADNTLNCAVCDSLRPPRSSYRDRMLPAAPHRDCPPLDRGGFRDFEDDSSSSDSGYNGRDSRGSAERLAQSAVLGAGLGAGLAWLQGGSL
eukprot:CAMPEP_0170060058 /NCGR_PEP_ID=MMETSP0019_2-20121128/2116_1 /TAXON_ID=98059 /ORGANISM="Dinobryon sp., Strain UTEXLB2267" /LENGTH=245 /DNA_ID=CAMNT_0010265489 /DNA_START=82 /DNA_END=815 /DNA_ORIENTATION=+